MSDRPSWSLATGARVAGDRRVLAPLGGGKRTEVVLAEDAATRRRVVVKLLRPGASAAAGRALAAEGELLGRLTHPLFPRLVEDRSGEEPACLVIEHAPGERLSTVLRRSGAVAPGAALALAAALSDGLADLAGVGFVHLDVKPSNTILGSRPRLIDLGVARSLTAALEVRGMVGSHRFQSPEQHHPERFGGLTPAADVWGVGVTVATALRGGSPFGPLLDAAGERRKLAPRDVAGLELPPDVPPAVSRLVRDAMAWEPTARPTAAELAARARGVLGSLGP